MECWWFPGDLRTLAYLPTLRDQLYSRRVTQPWRASFAMYTSEPPILDGITSWLSCDEKHWIVGATPLVKRIIRHCVACRRRDAQPCQQKEADLPVDRITPHEPAFTSVGVDYFGPFAVKRGRETDKETT